MHVIKGNYKSFCILLKNSDNEVVTDLSSAVDILFLVKNKKTDADEDAVISKSKDDMSLNDPSTGYIKVSVTSADTSIDPGSYYVGLQVNYSSTEKIEIGLFEDGRETGTFAIIQDVVRG